jgi:hypothetical protein
MVLLKWVEPMGDAGADQYTFHIEATANTDVEQLSRKVGTFFFF